MASSNAQYFHYTLYRFTREAYQAVIADFCETINDVSAQCWYDVEEHHFWLSCPTAIGHEADLALGNAISKYIQTELTAAELQSRVCTLNHFLENSLNIPEDCSAPILTEPTSSYDAFARPKPRKSPIFHCISTNTTSTTLLKFFKLRDLPEGMMERTLAVGNAKSKKIFESSFTCRVTRWSESKHDYVFNGRIGTPPTSTNNVPHSHIFSSTPFITLEGQQKNTKTFENESTLHAKHFRFVGDIPSVHQWVEGMGQVEPDGPDYMPEPPKDAKKFKNRPIHQNSATWRARIPKDVKLTTDDSDQEDNEEDIRDAGGEANLFQLFGSKDRLNNRNEENSQSEDSADADEGLPFDSLFKSAQTEKAAGRLTAKPPANKTSTSIAADLPAPICHQAYDTSTSHSSKSIGKDTSASSSKQDEYFGEGNRFAKLDNYGLTSNAANQAAWEHSNPAPRKSKSNRSGIELRSSSQSATRCSSSSAVSQNTPLEQTMPRASHSVATLRGHGVDAQAWSSYLDIQGDARPWTNKVNRQTFQKKMIDDSSSQCPSPIKLPPGYPGYEFSQPRDAAQSTSAAQKNIEFNQTCFPGNSLETLIDVTDDDAESARPMVKMPSMNALLVPTSRAPTQPVQSCTELREDDEINERLQLDPQNTIHKKYTMHQKARKKSRASNSTSKKNGKPVPTVNLPKPDPLPQPKKSSTVPQPATANLSITPASESEGFGPNKSTMTVQARGDISATEQQYNRIPSLPVSGLPNLLQDLVFSSETIGAELDISFGIIMLRHPSDKNFLNGAHAPKRVEMKIQSAASNLHTDFISRITTSEADAVFLLDLFYGDEVCAKVEYEIHIKTSEGESELVRFEQKAIEDFLVLRTDTAVTKLFMHYPMRVWDARATVNKPEFDLEMMNSVGTFVRSIQTIEQAPSFLAVVPSQLFTVEKVYAKRIFYKTSDSIEIRITEVQQLSLDSISSENFNFKASSLSKEEMIDQQRFWWECDLHAERLESVPITTLQEMVDHFVNEMGVVGWYNKGPFERTEIEASSDQNLVEIPFW